MPTTKALSASKFFGKDKYEYYLNELLTQQKVGGNVLSKSQIKEGFLKRKDKISFEKFVEKVISTKTAKSAITPPEIKSSPVAGGVGLGSRGGGLVKSPTGALEKYVSGVSKPQKMSGIEDDISKITKSVISIAEILSGQKKLKDSSTSYDRRKAEQEKRGLAESKLEKRFDGLKKAAEKILAPVKSLLDKIINFLVTVFLGRVVYKLLEWFGDPKNADKVRAISRFLGDHWPKLLALYLTFGTSVGRFALGLTKIVAKGAIKLLAKILLLSKAKKLSAAGRFLGGKGGKIAAAVLGTAAVVGGAYALTQGMKGNGEEPETSKPEKPKVPGYAGGGIIKIPAFKGGGFNFKGMFGGALGSSPEKPEEIPNGFVSGEKGVDKVPAMLSDGEFVMSVGAVQKYGVDTLEGMNAAGGGTNRPKMMGGKTYAEGGGMIGKTPKEVKLRQSYDYRFGKDFASKLTNDQLSSISKHYNSLPDEMSSAIESRRMQGYPDELKDMAERMIKGQKPKSFVEMSRAAAGLTDLEKNLRLDEKISSTLRYGNDLPKLNKPKSPVLKIDPSKMLPAAGQSSANMMKAVRAPIPASRAIVPYAGGGALARQGGEALARQGGGALATKPLQQIGTNMNVPGGKSFGKGGVLGTIATTLVEMFAPQIQEAVGNMYDKMGIGMGNLSDKQLKKQIEDELKIQKGNSSGSGDAALLGDHANSSSYERMQLLQREVGKRNLNQGGAIKGGFGLKDQSFKDAPKTQIMTDDKGRPFIGYKSMKNGKLHYSRGPQPGGLSTNPLEAFGRAINPGAYKDNDAKLAMEKQRVAATNSLESYQKQGMFADAQGRMMKQIGVNSNQTQNDLSYRQNQAKIAKTNTPIKSVSPPGVKGSGVYSTPIGVNRSNNGGRRSSGAGSQTPSFSARNSSGGRSKQETLGLMR